MRILNLYAGLGGNRAKWGDEHEITAVEMEPDIAKVYQDNFPKDKVIIGDAHEYLIQNSESFDFVWSSPPCQTHSRMMKATRHKKKRYTDMSLYQEIIFLKNFYKGRFVVENVKPFYEPLIAPDYILGRHYFWTNFKIPKTFKIPQFKGFITVGTAKETEALKKWLGIYYEGNIYYKDNHCPGQVLRNCVHPDTGKHILNAAMGVVVANSSNQTSIYDLLPSS